MLIVTTDVVLRMNCGTAQSEMSSSQVGVKRCGSAVPAHFFTAIPLVLVG